MLFKQDTRVYCADTDSLGSSTMTLPQQKRVTSNTLDLPQSFLIPNPFSLVVPTDLPPLMPAHMTSHVVGLQGTHELHQQYSPQILLHCHHKGLACQKQVINSLKSSWFCWPTLQSDGAHPLVPNSFSTVVPTGLPSLVPTSNPFIQWYIQASHHWYHTQMACGALGPAMLLLQVTSTPTPLL